MEIFASETHFLALGQTGAMVLMMRRMIANLVSGVFERRYVYRERKRGKERKLQCERQKRDCQRVNESCEREAERERQREREREREQECVSFVAGRTITHDQLMFERLTKCVCAYAYIKRHACAHTYWFFSLFSQAHSIVGVVCVT